MPQFTAPMNWSALSSYVGFRRMKQAQHQQGMDHKAQTSRTIDAGMIPRSSAASLRERPQALPSRSMRRATLRDLDCNCRNCWQMRAGEALLSIRSVARFSDFKSRSKPGQSAACAMLPSPSEKTHHAKNVPFQSLIPSILVEPIKRVQCAHGQFAISGIDQNGKLDFTCGDGEDINALFRQGPECLGCNTRMAAHAYANG
jgi:hypothetical protein